MINASAWLHQTLGTAWEGARIMHFVIAGIERQVEYMPELVADNCWRILSGVSNEY
ncbi:MAG: hypothetical protein QOD80_415 [Verrucomicrobiota bacterium]